MNSFDYKLFLIYSHKDTFQCDYLKINLAEYAKQQSNISINIDNDNTFIEATNWKTQATSKINKADAVLLVVSDNSIKSSYVQEELELIKKSGKILIPIDFNDTKDIKGFDEIVIKFNIGNANEAWDKVIKALTIKHINEDLYNLCITPLAGHQGANTVSMLLLNQKIFDIMSSQVPFYCDVFSENNYFEYIKSEELFIPFRAEAEKWSVFKTPFIATNTLSQIYENPKPVIINLQFSTHFETFEKNEKYLIDFNDILNKMKAKLLLVLDFPTLFYGNQLPLEQQLSLFEKKDVMLVVNRFPKDTDSESNIELNKIKSVCSEKEISYIGYIFDDYLISSAILADFKKIYNKYNFNWIHEPTESKEHLITHIEVSLLTDPITSLNSKYPKLSDRRNVLVISGSIEKNLSLWLKLLENNYQLMIIGDDDLPSSQYLIDTATQKNSGIFHIRDIRTEEAIEIFRRKLQHRNWCYSKLNVLKTISHINFGEIKKKIKK